MNKSKLETYIRGSESADPLFSHNGIYTKNEYTEPYLIYISGFLDQEDVHVPLGEL